MKRTSYAAEHLRTAGHPDHAVCTVYLRQLRKQEELNMTLTTLKNARSNLLVLLSWARKEPPMPNNFGAGLAF